MASKVRKIGNSAGVILPKSALAALGVSEGAAVEFVYEPGKVSITPARREVREGWADDFAALAAEGLAVEDREWLEADLTPDSQDEWDAFSEEDMARIEAQLRADGVVKA
ncbi:AbrB/MazE/SpoVT family DNA-binding domain-containing protein [Brevundimonas sp. PAMC22021]|uniref:AbrB/MazE/SpoVT family DNA-binding domain-containing protein n=1 Tax=Brevundimonas sp. PAMC22021 TaxID=2861285 RepID=UPI001C638EF9|nr:AbrB/MazE/SpoVT family DNA-binding domain-containing protein [Brevundimonas sp. PAMC22021]QYF87470.1 AbrB/MazE/SpoVT family DNA-binding domain-containing protein [Brevundimonas sp. PAMC22021]